MLSWWRRRRRQRLLSRCRIDPGIWAAVLPRVRAVRHLDPGARVRLHDLASLFLHEKAIEAAADLVLTPAMRARLACEACVPILNLGLDSCRGWHALIVYPGTFVTRHEYRDEAGVVHREPEARAGESWARGPLIVSWNDAVSDHAGYSPIIHEMAHKLDLLDGSANGCPPLHRSMRYVDWTDSFSAAYQGLQRRERSGDEIELDPYCLESPAEFFAVASEYFFTASAILHRTCPAVYEQLTQFYRQRPLASEPVTQEKVSQASDRIS